MSRCLACGGPIEAFLRFGPMPVANGFLKAWEFAQEPFYNLNVGFCERCTMVQLIEPLDPGALFHDSYPFFTSSSLFMSAHFRRLATDVAQSVATDPGAFVVEIGSNDGTMLAELKSRGIRHLGIDPSANVAEVSRQNGISTLCAFFTESTAQNVLAEHGKASVIMAANCFCHIRDLHDLARGITLLLDRRGILIFEDPYLGDILRLTSYDQIYDEHVCYFSLAAVENWLGPYGLEVINAEPQDVHGGSMRYTIAHTGSRPSLPGVSVLRDHESKAGLHLGETYDFFTQRVERSRDRLASELRTLTQAGHRIVGYGATSKSTTVLNYCSITPDLMEFISDTTPLKQGRFSPGMHIPVRPHAAFASDYPDYALLFAWNHSREILAKERGFRDAGGRWIRYVPYVEVF